MRIVILVVLALLVSAQAQQPEAGLRFTLKEAGLEALTHEVVTVLENTFRSLPLPGVITLDEHVPVLGHLTITLSQLAISNMHLTADMAVGEDPASLSLAVRNMGLTFSLRFQARRVHWPHVSFSGNVDATPSQGNADLTVALTLNKTTGHPHAAATTDTVSVGGFSIKIHGKWYDWLLQLFAKMLEGTLKDKIQAAIAAALQKAVDVSLNQAFEKMTWSKRMFGGRSALDLSYVLTDITAQSASSAGDAGAYLSVGDWMGVRNVLSGEVCPLSTALPTLIPGSESSMVQVLFADSVFNCMLWVQYTNGALDRTVTPLNSTGKFPVPLNTTGWKAFIPTLYSKYPNKAMAVGINFNAQPVVTTAPGTGMTANISLDAPLSVYQGAVTNTSVPTFALTLGVDLQVGFSVHVVSAPTNTTVHLNITALDIDISVRKTAIGPVNAGLLETLAKLLGPVAEGLINQALKDGIQLPTAPGFTFVDEQVTFQKGFFAISSDFKLVSTHHGPRIPIAR